MSTICLTVHDLRVLLGADREDHSCHIRNHDYPDAIVEKTTVDHWSSRYQLQSEELDLTSEEIGRKLAPGKERTGAAA